MLAWVVNFQKQSYMIKSFSNCNFCLDLNAKGVILRAFEGFRLKTCVDFKPYDGETSFIKFKKETG